MSKRQIIIVSGAWVAVLPFLGFPSTWEKALAIASGFVIIAAAYLLKPSASASPEDGLASAPGPASADAPYVEHKNEAPHN